MKILLFTVTYNNASQCLALLRSLSNNKDVHKIVIVDNDSNLEEFEKLRLGIKKLKDNKKILLIKNKNVGLTRAWNYVLKRFDNYDYYISASSDVILRKKTIATLKETMLNKKSEDPVLCSVLYSIVKLKKTNVLQSAGSFFHNEDKIKFKLLNAINLKKDRQEFIIQEKDLVINKQIRCSSAPFGCVMFSKDLFKKIGLFNENFFLFNEDSDFYLRLKLANIPVYIVTDAKVWHPDESISKGDNAFLIYHRILSGILFYRIHKKNLEKSYILKYSIYVFSKAIQSLFRFKFKICKVILKAYLTGFRKEILPIYKLGK